MIQTAGSSHKERPRKCLSRVRGNSHARFLGGWGLVTVPGYPTLRKVVSVKIELNEESISDLFVSNEQHKNVMIGICKSIRRKVGFRTFEKEYGIHLEKFNNGDEYYCLVVKCGGIWRSFTNMADEVSELLTAMSEALTIADPDGFLTEQTINLTS